MASVSSAPSQKTTDLRRKSCETVCSSNSSCLLQRRKPTHPLAASVRPIGVRSGGSVGQRVFSAKLLKLRSLQNQLNDANYHLSELVKENRALKTLQKRQDKALSKYEGETADLPKVIKTYEAEIAVLQDKNKTLRKALREASEQLKIREDELLVAREQLTKLQNLTKEKNLKERHKLTEDVHELKESLQKCEEQISVLNRKLILETKNSKHRLNAETAKTKQCKVELQNALAEIDRLNELLGTKDKPLAVRRRFAHLPQRQAVSMVSLAAKTFRTSSTKTDDEENHSDDKTSTPDLTKLEPITKKLENRAASLSTILKPASESVKARLSVQENGDESSEDERRKPFSAKSVFTVVSAEQSVRVRPSSTQKLEKLEALVQNTMKKKEENETLDADDKLLGNIYTKVISSVKESNQTVYQHKATLEQSKIDAEKLLNELEKTDHMNKKLQHTNFALNESASNNNGTVGEFLKKEVIFQSHFNNNEKKMKELDFLINATDKNGNITSKDPKVTLEEKQKLLSALKAIDNGENVDVPIVNNASRRNKLMKEILGDTHK